MLLAFYLDFLKTDFS